MVNNESLDEQQKRQQQKGQPGKRNVLLCSSTKQMRTEWSSLHQFPEMKMRDDSGLLCAPKENRVVGRRGPATSTALILQTTATKDSTQIYPDFQFVLGSMNWQLQSQFYGEFIVNVHVGTDLIIWKQLKDSCIL